MLLLCARRTFASIAAHSRRLPCLRIAATAHLACFRRPLGSNYFGFGPSGLLQPSASASGDYTRQLYYKPWARAPPYLVGVLLGTLLHTHPPASIRIPFVARTVGTLLALFIFGGTLFGTYGPSNNNSFAPEVNDLYNATSRFAWALGQAWLVYLCMARQAGYVGSLINARFWIPLSRLTYSCYLIHPVLLMVFIKRCVVLCPECCLGIRNTGHSVLQSDVVTRACLTHRLACAVWISRSTSTRR